MGHSFCHSKWRLQSNAEGFSHWRNEPCFQNVKPHYLTSQSIQVELTPTLKGTNVYNSSLTPTLANKFIDDVLEVCPGVTRRLDEWTFEYPLGSHEAYWKFLGVASLLRAVEEWWHWVDNYFEMKEAGIPRDVALICMGLYEQQWANPGCGHMIIDSLYNLESLKDFNLQAAFLERCKVAGQGSSLWSLIKQRPWFGEFYNFPNWFKMTPKVYQAFCDGTPIMELQQLVKGKSYNAIG